MTPEEIAAFQDLLQQSGHRRRDLFFLAGADQLSPVEQSAMAKIKTIDGAFDSLLKPSPITNNLRNDLRRSEGFMRRYSDGRGTDGGGASDLSAIQRAAAIKLLTCVSNLDEWLQHSVFDLK
jgi:hypothetical protein